MSSSPKSSGVLIYHTFRLDGSPLPRIPRPANYDNDVQSLLTVFRTLDPEALERLPKTPFLEHDKVVSKVLLRIMMVPGRTIAQYASFLELPRHQVDHAVKRLREHDAIGEAKIGRTRHLYALQKDVEGGPPGPPFGWRVHAAHQKEPYLDVLLILLIHELAGHSAVPAREIARYTGISEETCKGRLKRLRGKSAGGTPLDCVVRRDGGWGLSEASMDFYGHLWSLIEPHENDERISVHDDRDLDPCTTPGCPKEHKDLAVDPYTLELLRLARFMLNPTILETLEHLRQSAPSLEDAQTAEAA